MIPTKEVLCHAAIEECIANFGTTCPFTALSWQDHAGDLIKHLMATDCNTTIGNNALVALDYLGFTEEAFNNGYINEKQFELIGEKEGAVYFHANNVTHINGKKVEKETYTITFRDLIEHLLPSED